MRTAQFDGGRYRELRERMEMTLAEVAAKAGTELERTLHASTVGHIERGQRQPSAKIAGALCRAIGASWDDLIQSKDKTCSADPTSSAGRQSRRSSAASAAARDGSSMAATNGVGRSSAAAIAARGVASYE